MPLRGGSRLPETESSRELLRRARLGESAALNRLFARYVTPLRRWAHGRLPLWARGMLDTADLVQETLFRTFNRLRHFDPQGRGALRAYLREALLNQIRDEMRRAARAPARVALDDTLPGHEASPLAEAISNEELQRYRAALERVKPSERDLIMARLELGYEYDQIALALDKASPDAARVATRRAVVHLAEEMNREA